MSGSYCILVSLFCASFYVPVGVASFSAATRTELSGNTAGGSCVDGNIVITVPDLF